MACQVRTLCERSEDCEPDYWTVGGHRQKTMNSKISSGAGQSAGNIEGGEDGNVVTGRLIWTADGLIV